MPHLPVGSRVLRERVTLSPTGSNRSFTPALDWTDDVKHSYWRMATLAPLGMSEQLKRWLTWPSQAWRYPGTPQETLAALMTAPCVDS